MYLSQEETRTERHRHLKKLECIFTIGKNVPSARIPTENVPRSLGAGRLGRPDLFPMSSLSLSRAASAASREEKRTKASPVLLPLLLITMVTPFSASSNPEKTPDALVTRVPRGERGDARSAAPYRKRSAGCRPRCRRRGDLGAAPPASRG